MDMIKKLYKAILVQGWWIYRMLFKACHLEIHLADHCNLNCAGCSHYSPLANPTFCDISQLHYSLSKLSDFANEFRTIRLLGGEPLLNPEVADVIKAVRSYFPNTHIELLSNGIMLMSPYAEHINETFWESCRKNNIVISISIYPTRTDDNFIKKVCLEKGVKFNIYGDRTKNSCFKLYSLNPKRQGCRMNYYRCREIDFLQLADGKIFSCAQCAYVGHLNRALGYNFEPRKGDYIAVDSIDSIFALRLFRLKSKPFCKYCVFPRQQTDWHLSERKSAEWIQENV